MSIHITTEAAPIRADGTGALRVGNSRVLLELVIRAYDEGLTPELITERYPSLQLPDVYAAIAYYLRHQQQIANYLKQREQLAVEVQERVEGSQPDLGAVSERLDSHRKA